MDKLLDLICDEFVLSKEDINSNTLLMEFISDEFDMLHLVESINEAYEIEFESELNDEMSIADLAREIDEY